MPTTIQLPAGTEWVTVRSIPKLFAIALHGEPPSGNEMTAADMVWHGAVIEVEETIKRAVMQDELMPRNALSRRPMPDVRGEALRDAIVTVADLAEFAAQFVVGVSVEAAQTGTTPALAKVGAGGTVSEAKQAAPVEAKEPPRTNKKTWDDDKLRVLWSESIQSGVTQPSLAKKYGISHQRISVLLKKAKGKFSAGGKSKNLIPAVGRPIIFPK